MKIYKKEHKGLLHFIFLKKGPDGQLESKTFPLEKLREAGSAKKKLVESANEDSGKFTDGEITFTPGEVAILKDLFDDQEKWAPNDAEFVFELKDIFDGKEPEKKEEPKPEKSEKEPGPAQEAKEEVKESEPEQPKEDKPEEPKTE